MRPALIVAILLTVLAAPVTCMAEAAKALTNQDVVQMVKAGLPESTILLSVQSAPADYRTTTEDLAELKRAGVPEAVRQAMVTKSAEVGERAPSTVADAKEDEDKKENTGKTIKVFIPDEWPTADKELFRACVDEVNVQRRQDGQAELEAISQGAKTRQAWGRAALGALATMAIAVTPVGGAAGLGGYASHGAQAKEQYAQSRVTQCMAERRGTEAQRQALQNMTDSQKQLLQQQMQQGTATGGTPGGQ